MTPASLKGKRLFDAKHPAAKDVTSHMAYHMPLAAKGIKPGICKPWPDMTPDEKKTWVDWVLSHFGGKPQPLKDSSGNPTKHALAAKAYGMPPPKSAEDVALIVELARKRKAML